MLVRESDKNHDQAGQQPSQEKFSKVRNFISGTVLEGVLMTPSEPNMSFYLSQWPMQPTVQDQILGGPRGLSPPKKSLIQIPLIQSQLISLINNFLFSHHSPERPPHAFANSLQCLSCIKSLRQDPPTHTAWGGVFELQVLVEVLYTHKSPSVQKNFAQTFLNSMAKSLH